MRRICQRFAQEGAAGLESKRRGQSNRRLPVELRKEALALVRARYADFGPTLAQEKLLEQHDIRVATETLRQWMIDDGIWLTCRQRKKRVQQPRHRRDCYGELVQIDGSDHHWWLDDIFTWQEQRRLTAQLTVHHKRIVRDRFADRLPPPGP